MTLEWHFRMATFTSNQAPPYAAREILSKKNSTGEIRFETDEHPMTVRIFHPATPVGPTGPLRPLMHSAGSQPDQ